MKTLGSLVLLVCAAVAQAHQAPKTYSPEHPPRANEETILNARVVSVDPAGARVTVRGVDVKADGGRDETFTVAAPAASTLAGLKRGTEVLLVLRGTTVVDLKVSVASGGEGGTAVQGTRKTAPAGSSTRGQAGRGRTTPRPIVTPLAVATPQPGVVPPQPVTVPVTPVGIVATPTPAYATPFPTPRPQATPIPVGTPRPVLLPSEAPSPATTPTPSPSPQL